MDQNAVTTLAAIGAASTKLDDRVTAFQIGDIVVPLALKQAGTSVHAELLGPVIEHLETMRAHPRRRAGSTVALDLASLIAIVNRQKLEGTTVAFVSDAPRVRVVFDWHAVNAGPAGWGQDEAIYAPPLSRRWRTWIDAAGTKIGQDAFADFLEDNLDDILEEPTGPKKLDLLQMARDLHVNEGRKFQRTVDPTTGDQSLSFVVDSGQSRTKIPREFAIAVPVFEGAGVAYKIRIGLKLDLQGDRAFFTMKLRNADAAKDDAIAGLRAQIATDCEIPVFAGTP